MIHEQIFLAKVGKLEHLESLKNGVVGCTGHRGYWCNDYRIIVQGGVYD